MCKTGLQLLSFLAWQISSGNVFYFVKRMVFEYEIIFYVKCVKIMHLFKICKIDFSTHCKNTQYFIKTHISEGRVLRNQFPSFKIKLVEKGICFTQSVPNWGQRSRRVLATSRELLAGPPSGQPDPGSTGQSAFAGL